MARKYNSIFGYEIRNLGVMIVIFEVPFMHREKTHLLLLAVQRQSRLISLKRLTCQY